MTLLGKALRTLGGLGGSALGGMVGMGPTGGAAGTSLGAALSKWLGSGDYTVTSNSILAGSVKSTSSIPDMHNNGQSVIVRHKEYVGQVTSSQNFAVRYSLPLNPGRADTFPWLTNIAANFQEYTFKGVVYHYIPSSGSAIASTNNALGTVMFQTTYRANDSAPGSKHELLNEYWAGEAMPCETLCHPIECDPKENPFNVQYVRTGNVPTGDSQLMYDLGTTFIAVAGQQANDIVLGDVWVTYEVELRKPVLFSAVTSGSTWVNRIYLGGTFSASTYFPTDSTLTSEGLLPAIGDNGSRTVRIPAGVNGIFTISLMLGTNGGVADWTTSGGSSLSNCSFYASTIGFDTDQASVLTTGTAVRVLFFNVVVRKSNREVDATITLPGYTAGAGTVDYAMLRVTRASI